MMKTCRTCKVVKQLTIEFFKQQKIKGQTSWRSKCRHCINLRRVELARARGVSKRAQYIWGECVRCCDSCKESKKYNANNWRKGRLICRACFNMNERHRFNSASEEEKKIRSIKNAKFYLANSSTIKRRRLNNLEDCKKREKADYIKRKERGYFKEYRKRPETQRRINEWRRNKRQEDPEYKLARNVSRAVHRFLTIQGYSKNGKKFFEHVGYTIKDLKSHFESQFETWMNWDNYGAFQKDKRTWNLDHVYPQSKLPYDSMEHPNFTKCWALENLRPLDARQNSSKGNKIIGF